VNDGNAFYAHGGIAGHAGLFSTVDDINVLLSVIVNGGEIGGKRIYKKETVDLFLQRNEFGHGLGWQLLSLADSSEAPIRAFGHSGFTGTWGIGLPDHKFVLVLLTNRQNVGVNQRGYYNDVGSLRRKVEREIVRLISKERLTTPRVSRSAEEAINISLSRRPRLCLNLSSVPRFVSVIN
jgi:CubicO group peptidase (beta-lactamase class C family)